jgi:hypothetical protein
VRQPREKGKNKHLERDRLPRPDAARNVVVIAPASGDDGRSAATGSMFEKTNGRGDMTARERFLSVLNFQAPDDRLPMVEWAAWWDLTINRWKSEGLPPDIGWEASLDYFGLDKLVCVGASGGPVGSPDSVPRVVTDDKRYDAIRPYLYSDATIEGAVKHARSLKDRHDRGELIVRVWLDGYFWFPRALMGIERHLFAFYDQPGLMHRINTDLAAYNKRAMAAIGEVLKPDMVGFAEDMSYNHGPMMSRAQID